MKKRAFQLTKPLDQLSRREWEDLCARCGRCCVHKFRTPQSRRVHYTRIACEFLDMETCRCTCYRDRKRKAPECLDLYTVPRKTLLWLPDTCAYKRLAKGEGLPPWHPLVTGDPDSAIHSGMSMAGHALPPAKPARRRKR